MKNACTLSLHIWHRKIIVSSLGLLQLLSQHICSLRGFFHYHFLAIFLSWIMGANMLLAYSEVSNRNTYVKLENTYVRLEWPNQLFITLNRPESSYVLSSFFSFGATSTTNNLLKVPFHHIFNTFISYFLHFFTVLMSTYIRFEIIFWERR